MVYESDHWIDRKEVTKETLAWLDTYLGPVPRRPAGLCRLLTHARQIPRRYEANFARGSILCNKCH